MSCKAIRSADEMHCGHCGLQWDVDDLEPPKCCNGDPPMQRHKSIGFRALQEMKQNLVSDVVHTCSNCEFNKLHYCEKEQWSSGPYADRDTLQVLMNVDNSKCTKWRLKR